MTGGRLTPPAVVVGLDRSRAAISAAVWAVDEAVSRDIPLRLVAVAEQDATEETGDRLAEAELALREAVSAAESVSTSPAGSPLRIETAEGTKMLVAVHGGFFSVDSDRVNVIAEAAELAEEIDVERAKAALARAQQQTHEGDPESRAARRAETRLTVAMGGR